MGLVQKGEKVFLDTSGLVALFLKSDTNHAEVKYIWNQLRKSGCRLFTSEYVLDELLTLLLTKSSHHFACEVGQGLLNTSLMSLIYIQDEQVSAIFNKFNKYDDKQFSFTDVSSFYLMELEGIDKAVAFDEHFSQAGFTLLSLQDNADLHDYYRRRNKKTISLDQIFADRKKKH